MRKKPVKHLKENQVKRILEAKEREGGQGLGYRTLWILEEKHLI